MPLSTALPITTPIEVNGNITHYSYPDQRYAGNPTTIAVAKAFEALTAGQYVNLFSSGGILSARIATAADPTKFASAYVTADAAANANVIACMSGLNIVAAGLPIGALVWLGTGGLATATPPPEVAGTISQILGTVVGAGMYVDFRPKVPLLLSAAVSGKKLPIVYDAGGIRELQPSDVLPVAPLTPSFLTQAAETSALPNSRMLQAGNGITFDVSTPGFMGINATITPAPPLNAVQFAVSGGLGGDAKLKFIPGAAAQLQLDTTCTLYWGLTGYTAGISSVSLGTLEVNNGTKGQHGRLNLNNLYADAEIVGNSLVSNTTIDAPGPVRVNGGAATPTLALDTTQAAGTQHALNFTTSNVMHWQVRDSVATFAFAHFDDYGTYLGDSWQLDRTSRTFYVQGPAVTPRTDNATVLGSGSLRYSALYAVTGTIQTSDARMKKDIADSALGLSFIESLRPVSYKWIVGKNIAEPTGDGSDVDAPMKVTPLPGVRTHYGLIAQEVAQAVQASGVVDFGGYVADKDNADAPLGLNYSEFIAPLIKAVQELSAKVKTLEAQLGAL